MYDVVVVPLDQSSHAEMVVPTAKEEAARHGARLVLVHIVPRPELPSELGRRSGPAPVETRYPEAQRDALLQRATEYLEDVKRRYELPEGTEIVTKVGEPARRIMALLSEFESPLVVLTSGDPTPVEPRPSVSTLPYRIMVEGLWPVLALRPNRRTLAQPAPARGWHAPKVGRRDDSDLFEPEG